MASKILKTEMKQFFSEMNIVQKLKSARVRNSNGLKAVVAGASLGVGYLALNKRVTACAVDTPEVKKSALM